MKIIICEDNTQQRKRIHSIIYNYTLMEFPSVEIVLSASSPLEVLSYIQYHKADCYFLDIEFGHEINGLELAKTIRKKDPVASIIFITTHADMLKLTFEYYLAALDFIVKEDDLNTFSNQLIKSVSNAFRKYELLGQTQKNHYFQLKIGELIKNIPFQDIYYFETSYQIHKIIMYEKNGTYEFYETLKNLQKLDSRFYKCHKSYIVNLQHVKEINLKKREVIMINNDVCSISFRSLSEIKRKLTQWSEL